MVHNNSSREQQGSILITVLVMVSVLFLIATTVMSIASFTLRRGTRYGDRVRARWLAEGEMIHFLSRIAAGHETLKEKTYSIKAEDGKIDFSIKREDATGSFYLLESRAECGRSEATARRGVEAFYVTDYAVTVRSNWKISAKHIPGHIAGRIYIGGHLDLGVHKNANVRFFYHQDARPPLLTICGNLGLYNLDGEGEVDLFRSRSYHPYAVGAPWSGEGNPLVLLNEDTNAYFPGVSPDIQEEGLELRVLMPPFEQLYQQLYRQCDSSYRLLGKDIRGYKTAEIPNPKLLIKDLIAVGDGDKHMFKYTPQDREIKQLYLRRVYKGQPLDTVVIDPIADADAIGNSFFTARNGTLHVAGKGTRIFLQLPDDAYRVLGRIYYGTSTKSFCSVDHPLSKFYIDSMLENQRYRPGEHYTINYQEKFLEFTDPEFLGKHYYYLSARGDGSRLGFQIPAEKQRFRHVYVNGKLESGVKLESGTLFFSSPPPIGASIALMIRKPRIFARKDPPPEGIGLFVDKIVKPLKINLSEMNQYPSSGLIVSDRPLLVSGTASHAVTIVSREDIYINEINHDSSDPKPVGIISGKIVWVENSTMATNVSRRVFIYTEADRVYTTTMNAPRNKYNRNFLRGTCFIVGSVFLGGKIRNVYYDYPESMQDPNALVFSDEPFFSVQYRYDPEFQNRGSLPPGISPLVRIRWWQR